MLPPWPGWDGLHPLVIHFPVALLLVVPVFLLLAVVWRQHATGFRVSALILLVLGTAAAFVAASTGQAAAELADRTEGITAAIALHEELAERVVSIFTAITICYAVLLVLPRLVKRLARPGVQAVVTLLMLAAVLAASLPLAAAAHQGGMLVHKFGVHAMLAKGS